MNESMTIAEIGCNHKGDFDTAVEMIRIASQFCKVDAVKFQKRSVRELFTAEEYSARHPNEMHSYGETYGEHREYLEFTIEQHEALKRECEDWNVIYSTSVWDLTSAKEITSLNPEYIKIPSASNTNFEVLDFLCNEYSGDIHVSLGMTTHEEENEIVGLLSNNGRNQDTVLYSCTSGYPVPDEDVCLLEIRRLIDQYGEHVKAIGFSGHHKGIALDVAAHVLGAQYIERHFTLDRTWKGTDHAASLEPDGMRRIVRDVAAVKGALQYKSKEILDIEKVQRKKIKWNK